MKTPLIILFIITNLNLLAQSRQLGFETGIGRSETTPSPIQARTAINTPNFGLTYEQQFSNKLRLSTGLLAQQMGYHGDIAWRKITFDPTPYPITFNHRSTYLSLPILFGKRFGDKLYFQPQLGLSISKLIKSNYNYTDEYNSSQSYTLKKYDLAANLKFCLGYQLKERLAVEFITNLQHSLIDNTVKSQIKNYPNPFDNSNEYYRTIFINFGVKYELRKD